VTLLLIFAALAFVFILLIWGGSTLLQGYLYQGPADKLPIRAAACGAAMALFLTLWCAYDRRNPGEVISLFEFSPQQVTEIEAFESVMKNEAGEETKILYRRQPGSSGATKDFVNDSNIKEDKGKPWVKNTSERMTVAILAYEKDKSEPTRFNANLVKDKNGKDVFPSELSDLRFTDSTGRWLTADSLGHIYRRKLGMVFWNIAVNLLHLVLWAVAFWIGMRFSFWHAVGLALAMWLFLMLAVQPMLFKLART
jgi:hypothetical protein